MSPALMRTFWWFLWACVFGVAVMATLLACIGMSVAAFLALIEDKLARKKRGLSRV